MLKSTFKNFIKEEIRNMLREDYASKLYKVEGLLITDTKKKTQTQVLSDIRSIPGVTTIDIEEYTPKVPKPGYIYDRATIKVDPYPYIKGGKPFTVENLQNVIDNINKIRGVVKFKAENPQLINIGI